MKLNRDLQDDITNNYSDNSYNNWEHWKYIWDTILMFEWDYTNNISASVMAWYMHAIEKKWICKPNMCDKTLEIASNILKKHNYSEEFIKDVHKYIKATDLLYRWDLKTDKEKLISDICISNVWSNYIYFIKSSIRLLLEINNDWNISDQEIVKFFSVDCPNLMWRLTNITWQDDNPFLTDIARSEWPNFTENRDRLGNQIEKTSGEIIKLVRYCELRRDKFSFRNINMMN